MGVGYFIGSSRLRSNNKTKEFLSSASTSAKATTDSQDDSFINKLEEKKAGNIAKLREYLNTQSNDKLSNEEVRKLLNVSDATACRYLDDPIRY
jgi:Fic family protein